jgi:hypothetical protein
LDREGAHASRNGVLSGEQQFAVVRKLEEGRELKRARQLAVPITLAEVRKAFVQVPKRKQALAGEELLLGVGYVGDYLRCPVSDDEDVLEHIFVLRLCWAVK